MLMFIILIPLMVMGFTGGTGNGAASSAGLSVLAGAQHVDTHGLGAHCWYALLVGSKQENRKMSIAQGSISEQSKCKKQNPSAFGFKMIHGHADWNPHKLSRWSLLSC